MKIITRNTIAVALAGALVASAATPSLARQGRNTAAAVGFAAGALVGAAAASNARGYYGGSAYYGPAPRSYYGGSAYYEPAPRSYYGAPEVYYSEPAPAYYGGRCWVDTDSGRGYGYYGPCRPETTDTLKSRNQ